MFTYRACFVGLETQVFELIQLLIFFPDNIRVFHDLRFEQLHSFLVVNQFKIQVELYVFGRA
jgi:hypothetical protein